MDVIFISVMILHPWSHTKISSDRYRNAGAGTALLLAVAVFDGPSSATTCFGVARRRTDKSQTGLRTAALMMHQGGVLYHAVSTCQHIISISLCVYLHVCSHSSHLRWNQDMMQSRVFQANSTQVFHANSVAFDLTWIGCVSQLACHALPVLTGHGSPEAVWKLGLCRQEALLTQRSLIFDKYPGTVTQRSLMLWLISMHYVSMHLSMNQITYQFTDKSWSYTSFLNIIADRQQMQDVLGSDGWPDPEFYHKDDPPS